MINLPLKDKGSAPEVRMMWSESIPVIKEKDDDGREFSVKVIAGNFGGADALPPNSISRAADKDHHVRILLIKMSPGSTITIPGVSPTLNRNLYFISGSTVKIGKEEYEYSQRFKLKGDEPVSLTNGDFEGTYWLLEGEPIGEKMSSYGPVILENDKAVRGALNHIRKNEFENWPWDFIDKFHPKGTERFIRFADGTEERPPL
jgi:redox-sensitive bicupin YhaK (pirin superfamily)